MATLTLQQVVATPAALMGVKAVWGRSQEAVMCFGSRGDAALKDKAHFSQGRTTAKKSLAQPYFLTIGGGKEVPDALRGRVLELVRATGVYGETTAFVRDETLRTRLSQWPVAVVISEVYAVKGEPHLIHDLGFPDRSILNNAYDSVIRKPDQVQKLWDTLKNWELQRRWEVQPPQGFRDPGKVQMFGTLYPTVTSKSKEGRRVWVLSRAAERDPRLKREAKERNREKNGGVLICESCKFSDALGAMFDAHHLQPLAAGIRESRVDDLAILCPTCHRCAHSKAKDKLSPIAVGDIRTYLDK